MLDKTGLKSDIKTMLNELKAMDDQDQSIDKFADLLSNAIDSFVKTGSVIATPADVVTATMSNSGGPVVAANNLNSTIQ